MDPARAAVEVSNLSKSFGPIVALTDVSFAIAPGAVGLLGPNGAGKSTLIKILLGLLHQDRGTARMLGIDIRRTREVRRRVGYMPESECYIPGLDAVAYVTYCGQLSGMPYAEAMKRAHLMLDLLGLDEERYRKVETYSAGMKQRLKLAQALVHDPELVLLDEPTNALDPEGRRELLLLVRDLAQKSGISVVVSTHILSDVETVCDRVVILHKGKLLVNDSIENLCRGGADSQRVTVRGDSEAFRHTLEQAGARLCRVSGNQRSTVFEVSFQGAADAARTVWQAARQSGCELRGLTRSRRTLEDVFLELVGDDDAKLER